MTATLVSNSDRVVLRDISWHTYQSLLKDFERQPAIRLTFDRGILEIRMPQTPHESYKKLFGRLVETLTEESDREIRSLGSMTCAREDLARGLEPDQCYYIQNERAVWDKEKIDLSIDPPPDLAIEIDITSSSLDRLQIYAALGVPEIWRYDGRSLLFYCLEGTEYQLRERSSVFPSLTTADIDRFVQLKKTTPENALIRLFRGWVREQFATPPNRS
jgi:Uma2 family endonuclease